MPGRKSSSAMPRPQSQRSDREDDRKWIRGTGNPPPIDEDNTEYIDTFEADGDDDPQNDAIAKEPSKSSASKSRPSKTSRKTSNSKPSNIKDEDKENTRRSLRHSTGSITSRTSKMRSRQKSLPNNNLPVEWGDMQSIFTGFNLEIWWRQAGTPLRMNALFVALLLTLALLHLLVAIVFISKSIRQTVRSPYVCETDECRKASTWLTSAMNTSRDPCDNFYEFMCENYRHESPEGTEGNLMAELIYYPGSKVELGANSMIAKIMKHFENDAQNDLSIRFYQACLNYPKRKDYGLNAFIDTLESIFGTRDFSNFESTSLSMEEIGANMFRHIGEATYINMAFYTYPFIIIARPSRKIHDVFDDPEHDDQNELLIQRLFDNLMPILGVTDDVQKRDTYLGIKTISTIETLLSDDLAKFQMPKTLDKPPPPEFINLVETTLTGLCPPMGIQLNIRELLRQFIKDEFRLEFYDLMSLKIFIAFEICFAEDPSKFSIFHVTYPKTAFIAPWIYGVFWDFLTSMDTRNLMSAWKIGPEDFPLNNANPLVDIKFDETEDHLELQCMLQLSTYLGYVPALHFLINSQKNPYEFLAEKEEEIEHLYEDTREWFSRVPPSEIHPSQAHMGKIILKRDFHPDVLMPLVSGWLDESEAIDRLKFGEDHLRNSFVALKFTIERARQNWLGSTNTGTHMKWWSSGEPYDLKSELFDSREPSIKTAEFEEVFLAANHEKWYKFLGRPQQNYILFLLQLFDEPHIGETLSLETGGLTYKILRSIYSLFADPFAPKRYTSFGLLESNLINIPDPNKNQPRTCTIMYNHLYLNPNEENLDVDEYFNFIFNTSTVGEYTWLYDQNILTLLPLKQSLHHMRKKRRALSKEPFSWTVAPEKRKMRMQRLLPGKILSKYSEEQLMFMSWVRNTCRGSWKTHEDTSKFNRFDLEATVIAILQQMEEFSRVWKCKKNSFMSNKGHPRCIQWVPS